MSFVFVHPAERQWKPTLRNNSEKVITDAAFVFRFPAAWRQEVIREDVASVAGNDEFVAAVSQSKPSEKLFCYSYGEPSYAVQCDFVQDGKRYRLFADLSEKQQENLPVKINDAAEIFTCPEDIDLGELSQPQNSPASLGLKPDELKKRSNVAAGVICPRYPRSRKKEYYLAVVDFKPVKPGVVTLSSSAASSWRKGELWLNGKKLEFLHNEARLELNSDVNRLVLKSPKDKFQFLIFNGDKEQAVEFIKK